MDSGQLAGSEAIDELRQFLRLRPDQVDAQVRLADLLFAKGNLEEAKMYYVAALRLDPSLAPVYNNLGNPYLKHGPGLSSDCSIQRSLAPQPR